MSDPRCIEHTYTAQDLVAVGGKAWNGKRVYFSNSYYDLTTKKFCPTRTLRDYLSEYDILIKKLQNKTSSSVMTEKKFDNMYNEGQEGFNPYR